MKTSLGFKIPLPKPGLRATATFALAMVAATVGSQLHAADTALEAAAKAMGTASLNSVQLTASGTNGTFGQSFKPGGPVPTFKVVSYTQTLNYANPSMRIEMQRTNPDGPLQGSGLPILPPLPRTEAAQTLLPNGTGALAMQLWMTPHGVIKDAQKNNATVTGRTISFKSGDNNIKATLGGDNTVQKVETLIDNPVTGDTPVEWEYSNYRDFGGVKYPTRIVQKQGGFGILDLTVSDVKPNAPATIEAPPADAQKKGGGGGGGGGAPTVNLVKVADGVHHVTGGSHHSMIVEFNDHVVLFEVPQNDARATAVIDATKKAFPNKPIRYVVNSHHHFDHAGGIRAAMAEGLTIIAQSQNKPYFERIAAMPHTLNPDRLAKTPKRPVIEGVDSKRVLTDGTMTLELYKLPTNHADTMLVGYLPKSKQLFQVDVYTPAPGAPPTAAASPLNPTAVGFNDEIGKLKLDVVQLIPGHGPRLVTIGELRTITGKSSGN